MPSRNHDYSIWKNLSAIAGYFKCLGGSVATIHGTIPTSSTIAKEHAEPQRVTSNTQQATGNKESWYTLNLVKTHAEPQRVTSNTQQATGILPKHMQNHNESPATHNKPPVTKKAGTR